MNKLSSSTGEKRMILRRVIIYGIAIFLVGVLQCSFFSRLKPFGSVPDMMLALVCAIALLDNTRAASVAAIGAGYFIDALGATSPSFSALFYIVCAAVAAMLAEKLLSRFLPFLLLMLSMLPLRGIFTYINLWTLYGDLPPVSVIWTVALPEALSTLVISIPIYFLIKLCTLPIGARSKFSF